MPIRNIGHLQCAEAQMMDTSKGKENVSYLLVTDQPATAGHAKFPSNKFFHINMF